MLYGTLDNMSPSQRGTLTYPKGTVPEVSVFSGTELFFSIGRGCVPELFSHCGPSSCSIPAVASSSVAWVAFFWPTIFQSVSFGSPALKSMSFRPGGYHFHMQRFENCLLALADSALSDHITSVSALPGRSVVSAFLKAALGRRDATDTRQGPRPQSRIRNHARMPIHIML